MATTTRPSGKGGTPKRIRTSIPPDLKSNGSSWDTILIFSSGCCSRKLDKRGSKQKWEKASVAPTVSTWTPWAWRSNSTASVTVSSVWRNVMPSISPAAVGSTRRWPRWKRAIPNSLSSSRTWRLTAD